MHSATPKVLHQVAGKALLGHVLDTAEKLSPSKIHLVVGHAKDQIKACFKERDINWVEQQEQLGTAHAVQQAIPDVPDDAHVLVLYGDVPLISAQALTQLVDSMSSHSLAILSAHLDDASGYGRILRDDSNSVCGIVEQKDANTQELKINEINTGILSARAKSLRAWLAQVDNNNAQGEFYLTDIVALAHQNGEPIACYQPQDNDEIIGINSRMELAHVERLYQRYQAEKLMAQGVTIIDPQRIDIRGDVQIGSDSIIDVNCVIQGPTIIGSNVSIAPNCVITASTIGDYCSVHANSVIEQTKVGQTVNIGPFARLRPGTELADDVRIGNFVETKNAKLAQGAKVNHLSYVGDATVGRKTNIGAGVITCNYDGINKHQTTIGEDVFVGSNSQLVAPVEISNGATIGAGSTITTNVGEKKLAICRAHQREISGWKRPKKTSKTTKEKA